ncbi:hypothetical protein [Pedobacter sp. ASV28]|uniref:hypothetical protein n=1 Tax=Pedobacter sp. ASV28 TaxID=2795123 RepID=UPI0018EBD46A|nr:hypothetical protein [Pedobacter sp. ASV28]
MKALSKMDNLDKGQLLCRLFPEELENLQQAVEKQCGHFLQNEQAFRTAWHRQAFVTAEFWYRLVQDAEKRIGRYKKELCRRPRWFADHFFDGYNALFTIYGLVEYADTADCNAQLKQAVHLLFGNEKLLSISSNG